MSQFEDRKNAFEQKYAQDEEMNFKAEARACKLFGLWLAEQMGMDRSDAEAFARDVVSANLDEPGFEDVKRFVMPRIQESGLTISEHQVDSKMSELMDEAKVQLMTEQAVS